MNPPQHIHIIGICGVATSALGIAFKDRGYKVTGSDKGFFPPVSTELEKHGIEFYAGWHPEKMGKPDVVIFGTASGTQNPETAYAKEHNLPLYSFAEAIGIYFVKERSIVATGTWGKTSSSALLSFILQKAELDPTYMFGGVSLSHTASAKLTDSTYSVFEGDEYKSSPTDTTPKFVYYKPTHLLLTAVSWDHADLYPTEESYFAVFKKLIANIPTSGYIIANKDNAKVSELVTGSDKKIVWYGKKDGENKENETDFTYDAIDQSENGLTFTITRHKKDSTDSEKYSVSSPMIGKFQAENITGCFAMAYELGIKPARILQAISEFKGLKRRLEKRYSGTVTVFDDIAHSPEKASSVLENIRSIYPKESGAKIIAVFEPNIGGRSRESAGKYDMAFKNADIVIIPRLTKLKTAEDTSEQPMEGAELAATISKTHSQTKYIEDDTELVKTILQDTQKQGDIVVFLGSHGFRGMIEETVTSLHQRSL